MLCCSHTHSGPALRECLQDYYPMDPKQRALNERYTLELEKTIVEKVAEAFSRLEPAVLCVGEGKTGFAVNRRNNSEAEAADRVERRLPLKGPVDHSVPVLAASRLDGSLRAIVFGYACHATTLSGYQWCGDYPGFAQVTLEDSHPGAMAMFHAGCGADQNPLPRRSVELCRKYGRMLATAVNEVLGRPMRPIASRLSTAIETVPLDYDRVVTRPELEDYVPKGSVYGRWAQRSAAPIGRGREAPHDLSLHRSGMETRRGPTLDQPGWRGRRQLRAPFQGRLWAAHVGDILHARPGGLHPFAPRVEGGRIRRRVPRRIRPSSATLGTSTSKTGLPLPSVG